MSDGDAVLWCSDANQIEIWHPTEIGEFNFFKKCALKFSCKIWHPTEMVNSIFSKNVHWNLVAKFDTQPKMVNSNFSKNVHLNLVVCTYFGWYICHSCWPYCCQPLLETTVACTSFGLRYIKLCYKQLMDRPKK
jgi:hypothetical protein